jgi:hypothetical protein
LLAKGATPFKQKATLPEGSVAFFCAGVGQSHDLQALSR